VRLPAREVSRRDEGVERALPKALAFDAEQVGPCPVQVDDPACGVEDEGRDGPEVEQLQVPLTGLTSARARLNSSFWSSRNGCWAW
jgi:hypothetical protein